MSNSAVGAISSPIERDAEAQLMWSIVGLLFICAVAFRLSWFGDYTFPINDGALFVVIAEAIMANGMVPPTEYDFNGHTLPLGYPPLGLWIAAALSRLTGADPVLVATWYPFATNLVVMAGFVGLLRAMKLPWMVLILAAAVFFFQDRTFKFLIMGGGITRGTGAAFTMLALWATVRMLDAPRIGSILTVAVLCGLAILSHLEFGITAATGITLLVLFSARPFLVRAGLLVAVGAISFAVILPWLVWVLSAHGLSAFTAASETSGWCLLCSTQLAIAGRLFPWYLIIPCVIGALELARQGKHVWLAYALAIFFLTPRHAPSALVIPNAVLAAYGMYHIYRILKEGAAAWSTPTDGSQFTVTSNASVNAIFVAVTAMTWTFVGATINTAQLTGMETLKRESRSAMGWINENVPAGSIFVTYSGEPWATDETAEWFPYFTSSYSISTAQGLEWVGNGVFERKVDQIETYVESDTCGAIVETTLAIFPKAEYLFAVEQMYCFDGDPRYSEVLRRPGVAVYKINRS